MLKAKAIKNILKEYGTRWAINRTLYSIKLKSMEIIPVTERIYEKRPAYPERLDLFDVDVKALGEFLRSTLSEDEKARLIDLADKACRGIITGFSSVELKYGNPIDWQLNPLTGRRTDEKRKWYTIPDFDRERGDIKAIWEASRFSHFITLARAYVLTGHMKYYKAFSNQLKHWLICNPYGYGANFKCGQECSLRMVNALITYNVFKKCGIATEEDTDFVSALIDRCYRKVLGNFNYAYRCIRNNHTISELMGMIVGAWCADDEKQIDKAYHMLDEVIDEQFTDDGGYKQFSFNYQRLALQDLECIMSISEKTGRSISGKSKEKIKKSALLMYQCLDDSGDMPNYGANDGAMVFPVSSCSYRDFRPAINTAYALTTGRRLFEEGKHLEELIWFSGGRDYREYEIEIKAKTSSRFVEAGLFTLRGQNSWAMVISNEYHCRPAHMDQLHLDMWVDNVNVLCDGGTYSYADEEGKTLVKNCHHNTAMVPGAWQMDTAGTFMLLNWPKRILVSCDDDCFEGGCVSANGYTHLRRIKRTGAAYEITDNVDKKYKLLFHTPCEVIRDGSTLLLLHEDKEKCRMTSSGKMEVTKSQRSLYYLNMEEINCISITGEAGEDVITLISEGEVKR